MDEFIEEFDKYLHISALECMEAVPDYVDDRNMKKIDKINLYKMMAFQEARMALNLKYRKFLNIKERE